MANIVITLFEVDIPDSELHALKARLLRTVENGAVNPVTSEEVFGGSAAEVVETR